MSAGDYAGIPGTGSGQPAPMNAPVARQLGIGVQPGTPNVIKAQLVIIFGTGSDTGLFVYNGTPGPGTLIASIAAPGVTSDPYGNTVRGGGLTVYGGTAQIFLGNIGGIAELLFRTGTAFEQAAGNISGSTTGAGGAQQMQLLVSGPQGSTAGGVDWTQIQLLSASQDGTTADGEAFLNYVDLLAAVHAMASWGAFGFNIQAGGTTAAHPGTGTQATPATPEGWNNFALVGGTSAGTDINGTTYTPAYQLLPTGDVKVRGVLLTGGAGLASGTTWATIPAGTNGLGQGYRPVTNIPTLLTSNAALSAFYHLYVRPNGNMQFDAAVGVNTRVFLDGILLTGGT